MKKDCDVIRDLMPLYSDNICSESSRKLVEEHCAECGECSKMLKAMSAELPKDVGSSGAKNPLKKIRRHYLKLALLTAVLAVPIAAVVCVLGAITVNQFEHSHQVTWASIAAENEMKSFGRALKKGNYRKALSDVGFVDLDGVYHKNEGELLDVYTDIYTGFFEEYPIKYIDCDASYYNAEMRGELYLYLDEKYTDDIPLCVYTAFEADESGDCYITQTMVSLYGDSNEYEGREEECREIYNKFYVPLYPGDAARMRIEAALSGSGIYQDQTNPQIITSEFKKYQGEIYRIVTEYSYEDEEYRSLIDAASEAENDYLTHYSKEVKRLFSEEYILVSVDADTPEYVDEPYLKGSVYENGSSCFKQRFTLNMKTGDREEFWVKFSSKVQLYADTPEDTEFSDNTPDDFKNGFTALFS